MPPQKKHLLFYIGSLAGGGAERVLIELLKNLSREKYHISLAINRPEGFFYDKIPGDVNVIDRSRLRKSPYDLKDRIFGLSKVIHQQQADLVVAFMIGAGRSLMRFHFLLDKRVKKIIRIGENPATKLSKNRSFAGRLLESFEIRRFLPKADALILTSNGIREELAASLNIVPDHIHIVHNPVDIKKISSLKQETVHLPFRKDLNSHKLIVAAGRLVPEKGYDDMIEVFYKVKKKVPAKLVILGKGPLKNEIQDLINQKGLQDDVYMPGFVKNPWAYMNHADIYLSTSKSEGFHLSIAEAMACGVTPVATNCDYGPREIISDGVNGRLVPVGDITSIAEAITELLTNTDRRNQLSEMAKKRALDFDISEIVPKYEKLFDTI
jgi:glycosyltransferase involved in cell wall biosynthesis